MFNFSSTAAMWNVQCERTTSAALTAPSIDEHGWNADGTINWVSEQYSDIIDLILDHENGYGDSE